MNKKSNKLGLAPFDACDYLDNEETIVEYLTAALENPDPNTFIVAIHDDAKAKGLSKLADKSDLGQQQHFDKAFKVGAQPSFNTVRKLINAMGIKFSVVTQSTC
ncbi:Transcriptional regulator [Candidatus Magnetomoraceae bacterium gMMP-15]